MKIPFSRIELSCNELKYIKEVLDSGWLTTASKAKELEAKFITILGVKHAFAVNSCTSALHLALEAAGVGAGDKVLVPSMTFTASAEVIHYLGATPVFLDVEYGTTLLSPGILERKLSEHSNIKAIVIVHFAGQPAPMLSGEQGVGLLDICRRHGVEVIEDAAHAFPARLGKEMVGAIGDATCFSFYANKTITTGEGGMLTTNDDRIATRVQLMRLHGIDRTVWERFTSNNSFWEYDVKAPGYKYNMPDVNAAIGLAQLERAESMRSSRQKIAELYIEELHNINALDLPIIRVPFEDHSWHLFTIILNDQAKIDRNKMITLLAKDEIGSSVHYKPLHRMTYYRKRHRLVPEDYPNTERIWKGCISLPIYSMMSKKEAHFVAKRIRHHLV